MSGDIDSMGFKEQNGIQGEKLKKIWISGSLAQQCPLQKTYSAELGNSKNSGEKILSMGGVGIAPPSHLDNNRPPVTYPAEGDH